MTIFISPGHKPTTFYAVVKAGKGIEQLHNVNMPITIYCFQPYSRIENELIRQNRAVQMSFFIIQKT